jgi:hypothetical protein
MTGNDTAWSADDLAQIDEHDEVRIASLRSDGTLTSDRIIWAVRLGDQVYVRSVNGPGAAWFRATRHRRAGELRVGGMSKDIAILDVDHADGIEDRIDAAYRAKYGRYSGPVASITTEQARATTLQLVPRPQ